MMLLHCAIVLLFAFSLGTSGAPGFDNNSRCITSPAVVGDTGSMTFLFRQDLNMSSDKFHAYIVRTGDAANVIQCDRRNGAGITCDVINRAFEHTTIENHSLKLTAANVTPELAGNYTLWILAGGSKEPPVECNFVVQNKTNVLPQQASSDTLSIVVPVVLVPLLVAAVLITGICILKRKNKLPCLSLRTRSRTDAPQALEENKRSKEQVPLLETPEDARGKLSFGQPEKPHYEVLSASDVTWLKEGKSNVQSIHYKMFDGLSTDLLFCGWYCLKTRQEDERNLMKFERNKVDGCFGIGRDPQNPKLYELKVYYGHKPNCLRLSAESDFQIVNTEPCFKTLSDLVAHYRENCIICKGTLYGKLVKPFEKAPEGPWYAGKMERLAQDDLLQSEANGHGAFLIRDCISEEKDYTLAVKIKGEVDPHVYRITVEDDGYKLGDADGQKYFPTLSALVEYYKENDLYVHGKFLGRLSNPAQGITGAAAAGTQEECGTEIK